VFARGGKNVGFPQALLRLRGLDAVQRPFVPGSRKLIGLLPPLSPFRGSEGLQSGLAPPMVLMKGLASRPLSRHLSVLPPRLLPKPPDHVDSLIQIPRHLAGALAPFSICGSHDPSFRLAASGKGASLSGSPALRVWLPSRRPAVVETLGSLFQLPTLLGFALQSFPPPQGSRSSFEPLSPLSRSPSKPRGLEPAPQRLSPLMEAVPLSAPPGVYPGSGPLLS
jgi:hypothetical protein